MSIDLRGEPTSVCICGSKLWNLKVIWDSDNSIGMYFLDMTCELCGALATAPTQTNEEGDDAYL